MSKTEQTLIAAHKYDYTTLDLVGWTEGDGSGHEGYNYLDYFGPSGVYLGPDDCGIEPIFEADSITEFEAR